MMAEAQCCSRTWSLVDPLLPRAAPRRAHVCKPMRKNSRWERQTIHEVASAQLARRGEARVADHVAHHAWLLFRGIATAAQLVVRNCFAAEGTASAVMRVDRPPTM